MGLICWPNINSVVTAHSAQHIFLSLVLKSYQTDMFVLPSAAAFNAILSGVLDTIKKSSWFTVAGCDFEA